MPSPSDPAGSGAPAPASKVSSAEKKIARRSAKREAKDRKHDRSRRDEAVPSTADAATALDGSASTSRKRSSAWRTRLLLIGVVTAVALFATAIALAYRGTSGTATAAADREPSAAGEIAAGVGGTVKPAETTTTQRPDVLPNPGVNTGECKMVTYTPPSAGEKQQGEVCRPVSNQRDTAVILVHGGAGVGGTYAGMKPWSNRLNTEGYVTFAIDYHLFTEGSASPVFPLPEQNIKASVQFLRGTANALGIRNDHIVVQGFSAGARLGAVAFTSPNDQYFVGKELWPYIPDEVNALVAFYHPLDGTMQYEYQYYGGDENSADPKVKARLDKADSLSNASNAVGPAAIITGEADWNIQITQGSEFIQALQDDGKDGAMLVVPGGGHGFDEGDGRNLSKLGEQSATGVLLFLNKAFPQSPERPAQANPPDVVNAPNSTGLPPTTYVYVPRTRPATPTTRGNTPKPSSAPTTQRYVPPSKPYVPPTSVKPSVTPKPTIAPTVPPTSNPPTSAPPGQ